MQKIVPVILAGGSGTRLWPLSRKSYPKQFANIFPGKSLFQLTALRFSSNELLYTAPIIITNNDFRFIVAQQLQEIGVTAEQIIIEPNAKNTAAAICAAMLCADSSDEIKHLLVVPSDQLITDEKLFNSCIKIGLSALQRGEIVTFGVQPDRPETGYGYLELDNSTSDDIMGLKSFIEKPDFENAEKLVLSGNFLWNSGMFLFRSIDMKSAYKVYAADILDQVTKAVASSKDDLDFTRLDAIHWDQVRSQSIDYAIMEKIKNIVVVPFSGKWTDLGSWEAIHKEMPKDNNFVATSKNAHAIDCNNTMLRSEDSAQQLVGIGLENIIVISMPDAVLVADKNRAQDVKAAVELLESMSVPQASVFPKHHRPWGWFESLFFGDRFQVKHVLVYPGASLSLQSHHHRSEHWIVVEGTAKVTVNGNATLLTEGESIYIPLGSKHRMENPGKIPILLIEVQTGIYLKDDDIMRYDDQYKKV